MRNSKQISFFAILFGLLSLLYIVIITEEFFLFFTYGVFLLLGMVFYRKQEEKMFFYLSLAVSVFFAIPLTYSYINATGSPFVIGGDAEDYYNKIIRMLQGDFSLYYGRYKMYLYIGYLFYKFVNLFVSTTHYAYLVFLNIFFCANIAPLLYKISVQFFDKKVVLKAGFLTVLFPGLIQVAAGTWREAIVYTLFMYLVYLSLNLKLKNIILYILTFFILANVRMEVAVVSFVFLICYNYVFVSEKNMSRMTESYLYLFLVIITFFILYNYRLFEYLNSEQSSSLLYQKNAYDGEISFYSETDSVTTNLRHRGFLGRILLFFYSLLAPIPPPVFAVRPVSFFNLFISIGHIMWYFIFPVSMVSIINTIKNKITSSFSKSFLVTFILGIAIIALTTVGTARHKLYLYPIVFLFFFYYNVITPNNKKRNIYFGIIVFYCICLLGYILFKYII